MTVSEKAKEKLDEASKEIKEAIDNLSLEVAELTKKVKEKVKGTGEEMRDSAEELTREVKGLSEKVRDLIPKRRKKAQLPVRINQRPEFRSEIWKQPFLALHEVMDRLFEDFFSRFERSVGEWQSPYQLTGDILSTDWPRVDMCETDSEILITAELPGVNKDDIDVSISSDRVTIRGEKKGREEQTGRDYYRLERYYGSFQRSFILPCDIEDKKADASFKNGILTIRLPKSATALERIKKIPIHTD
ncbi:MAG: Hsp20/alpha crystallin family protein [Deltaproteobacteria bacterium]|nr:Hsp20/alpha crystallin family protein [Deltaproteobacteria bacterium]